MRLAEGLHFDFEGTPYIVGKLVTSHAEDGPQVFQVITSAEAKRYSHILSFDSTLDATSDSASVQNLWQEMVPNASGIASLQDISSIFNQPTTEESILPRVVLLEVEETCPEDDNYFEADGRRYVLIVDQENVAIKIADGNYGAIFLAKLVEGQEENAKFAVKVFYDAEDGRSSAFHDEIKIGKGIRDLWDGELTLDSVVLPVAEAPKVLECPGMLNALEVFGIRSSCGHAYLMQLYTCSLKDILESGWQQDSDSVTEAGYNRLRDAEPSEREAVAAAITSRAALGCKSIHAAGFTHNDLKPANVLFRPRAGSLDIAVADLGFAKEHDRTAARSQETNLAGLPLGTRHYRSPEQRDFIDICEVSISEPAAANSVSEDVLEVHDPKFADSLVEANDWLRLSRESSTNNRAITKVEWCHRSKVEETQEALDEQPIARLHVAIARQTPLSADTRVQVIVRKRQTIRTDLFGLGALFYDILTAGRSPEALYDLIRHLDQRQADDGPDRIMELVQEYGSAKRSGGWRPEHAEIFRRFIPANREYDVGQYPSHQAVEVVLRLMLSRANSSYLGRYLAKQGPQAGSQLSPEQRAQVFDEVYQRLGRFSERVDSQFNCSLGLLTRKHQHGLDSHREVPRAVSLSSWIEEGNRLDQGSTEESTRSHAQHLALGAKILHTLSEILRDRLLRHLSEPNSDSFELPRLDPEDLRVMDDFELHVDGVLVTRLRDLQTRFARLSQHGLNWVDNVFHPFFSSLGKRVKILGLERSQDSGEWTLTFTFLGSEKFCPSLDGESVLVSSTLTDAGVQFRLVECQNKQRGPIAPSKHRWVARIQDLRTEKADMAERSLRWRNSVRAVINSEAILVRRPHLGTLYGGALARLLAAILVGGEWQNTTRVPEPFAMKLHMQVRNARWSPDERFDVLRRPPKTILAETEFAKHLARIYCWLLLRDPGNKTHTITPQQLGSIGRLIDQMTGKLLGERLGFQDMDRAGVSGRDLKEPNMRRIREQFDKEYYRLMR